MAECLLHNIATFECVDDSSVSVPGDASNGNGGLFFNVEANCNGMPCPPYNPEKSLPVWCAASKAIFVNMPFHE